MATSRITPQIKAIAEAHIKAKITGKFDDPIVNNKAEILQHLANGKTFSKLLDTIEIKFCSVGTLLMASGVLLDKHITKSYRAGIYKGFKNIFQ